MRRTLYTLVLVLVALSLTLSACATPTTTTPAAAEPTKVAQPTQAPQVEATKAPEQPTPTAQPLDPFDPAAVSGDIYSAGSSTVGPLSEAIQEMFIKDGFQGEIKNDIIGSGAGFERFCKTGETDIANASRKIKDSEIANCAALTPARTPLEFRVGTDAIAIVVSKDNDFATDITLKELELLFTTATKWSDVRPEWPAEDIQRFAPGTDSGTFDFFVEVVIQKPNKIEKLDEAKKLALNATNLQASEDDNVLVKGVEGSKYAIGYFGFAYYQREQGNLKALAINGVSPSLETAESGKYVLSRPLFIYSDAEIMKAKPQVAAFIHYYLSNVNLVIGEVGYFPASSDALLVAKQTWLDAVR